MMSRPGCPSKGKGTALVPWLSSRDRSVIWTSFWAGEMAGHRAPKTDRAQHRRLAEVVFAAAETAAAAMVEFVEDERPGADGVLAGVEIIDAGPGAGDA